MLLGVAVILGVALPGVMVPGDAGAQVLGDQIVPLRTTAHGLPKHDYGAGIMLDAGNVELYVWCGVAEDGSGVRESIFARRGSTGAVREIVRPREGQWDAFHTCDPTIVRGQFSYGGGWYAYALYYTASDRRCANPAGVNNAIGVAFANDPINGPWVRLPQPVVKMQNTAAGECNEWGAGEPVAIRAPGSGVAGVRLLYSDTSATPGGYDFKLFTATSTNGINFGAPVSVNVKGLAGHHGFNTGAESGGDFAYAPSGPGCPSGCYYGLFPVRGHLHAGADNVSGYDVAVIPSAGLTSASSSWMLLGQVNADTTLGGLNVSPAMKRDRYGQLGGSTSLPNLLLAVGSTRDGSIAGLLRTNNNEELDVHGLVWTPARTQLNRFVQPSVNERFTTTSATTPTGYVRETAFVASLDQAWAPGRQPLFSCFKGQPGPTGWIQDMFVSAHSNCEGLSVVAGRLAKHPENPFYGQTQMGFTYQDHVLGSEPIYRCVAASGDSFMSRSTTCEGLGVNQGGANYGHVFVEPSAGPKGSLDVMSYGSGRVRVAGWAIDWDAYGTWDQTVTVDVTVDRINGPRTRVASGSLIANVARPDLGVAYPNTVRSNPNDTTRGSHLHGFSGEIAATLTSGTYEVCVSGRNLGPSSSTPPLTNGCRTFSI